MSVYSPLLLRYRPCNCGGGSYERFYHHTIPEHSLDSASGYFRSMTRAVSGVVLHCITVWIWVS